MWDAPVCFTGHWQCCRFLGRQTQQRFLCGLPRHRCDQCDGFDHDIWPVMSNKERKTKKENFFAEDCKHFERKTKNNPRRGEKGKVKRKLLCKKRIVPPSRHWDVYELKLLRNENGCCMNWVNTWTLMGYDGWTPVQNWGWFSPSAFCVGYWTWQQQFWRERCIVIWVGKEMEDGVSIINIINKIVANIEWIKTSIYWRFAAIFKLVIDKSYSLLLLKLIKNHEGNELTYLIKLIKSHNQCNECADQHDKGCHCTARCWAIGWNQTNTFPGRYFCLLFGLLVFSVSFFFIHLIINLSNPSFLSTSLSSEPPIHFWAPASKIDLPL